VTNHVFLFGQFDYVKRFHFTVHTAQS